MKNTRRNNEERMIRAKNKQSYAYAKKEERVTRAVLAIISLLVIILAIGSIYGSITREFPPTVSVELAVVSGAELNRGIIIREEHVYTSPFRQINFSVENNTRVRQNDIVATVSNFSVPSLIEENEELANQILSIQSFRAPISIHTDYIDTINEQIREVTNNNLHRLGDLEFARYFEDHINAHVDTRNYLLLSENVGSLEPYVSQTIQNINIISENQRDVRATQGGIVSFSVDGFEHLNPSNMQGIQPWFVDNLANPNETTEEFKIVTSNTWYIATFLDNVAAAPLVQNMNVPVFVQDGADFREIRSNVHTLEHRGEYTLAIFSVTDFMLDYINERTINFKLENAQSAGLKIPQSAIANRTLLLVPNELINIGTDNHYITTITTQANETIHTTIDINPVTIRGHQTTEGYVYILQDFGNVQLGTALTQNGTHYVINQIVTDTGVFRVNNGVATFTSIDKTEMIEYETDGVRYFVLNTELNRGGIMPHDRIISDAQNYLVYEGQIVH